MVHRWSVSLLPLWVGLVALPAAAEEGVRADGGAAVDPGTASVEAQPPAGTSKSEGGRGNEPSAPSASAVATSAVLGALGGKAGRETPRGGAATASSKGDVREVSRLAGAAEARKLSDVFVAAAEKVRPSVVQIDVTLKEQRDDEWGAWLGSDGEGAPMARAMASGVVLTEDGAILTNNHVVEDALSLGVRLRDGRIFPGRVVGRDPATDLAVVKIETRGLVPAVFADSESARVGEWVVAVGSPFGLGYSVTSGVLSATGRGGLGMNLIEDYLQTDATIHPGNSGGPLCDLEGRVLGINTAVVGRATGIGFAVPATMARRVADQLLKTGRVQRAWLGIGIQDLVPDLATAFRVEPYSGALVNGVKENSPAYQANLRPGDIIASVAGKTVHSERDVTREMMAHEVGQSLSLEVVRQGKRYGTQVVLGSKPSEDRSVVSVDPTPPPSPGLGLGLKDLTPSQASQLGLPPKSIASIVTIATGSVGDRAGLVAGDVLVDVDGIAYPSARQVTEAAADGQMLARVARKGAFFYVSLKKDREGGGG